MKRFWASCALAVVFVAASGCNGKQTPPPPPAVPPVIRSFSVDKEKIARGESVKLTFTTEGAASVKLTDQGGTEIPVNGTADQGDATVTPSQSSFFVLTAEGTGGRDTAFVQVAVNEELKEVFLIAVPAEISSGESVTLVWNAQGASTATVADTNGAMVGSQLSGSSVQKPAKTTTYTLNANAAGKTLTATARVTVKPVIDSFTATPPTASPGKKMTFSWKTRGADTLQLRESTFGVLLSSSTQAEVDQGQLEFVVPFQTAADGGVLNPDAGLVDGGVNVVPNVPLKFTLTAATGSPVQSVERSLSSVTRDGPMISRFDVPASLTENKALEVSWQVSAHRVELKVDGFTAFASAPGASGSGSAKLAPIKADAVVTLLAFDHEGFSISESKTVKVVKPPAVTAFNLPMSVPSAGNGAMASWTTTNANRIIIRIKGGPAVFYTALPPMIPTGMTSVAPTMTTTYVLEAYNAAGDFASMEKTITVGAPATFTATPNPASPGSDVTFAWDVSGLMPIDVIGLPSETSQVVGNSTGFVDVTGHPNGKKLLLANPGDGSASLTAGDGFTFPFGGQFLKQFTAGVNGTLVIGGSSPALGTNVDLKGMTGLPPPLFAPFWDDLDLGADGAIWWMVTDDAFPRKLIVQWHKVDIAGDASSELTFQVQLFETGQVNFEYLTLQDGNGKGQGQGATVGIYGGAGFLAAQLGFNAQSVAELQQVQWFTQGSASGTTTYKVQGPVKPTFFVKRSNNTLSAVQVAVRVFGPGSVVVNEAMPNPSANVPMGQWVELFNPGAAPLDISGLRLQNASPPDSGVVVPFDGGFSFPEGTEIPAGGFLVVGSSTDPSMNDDAGVQLSWGSELTIGATSDGVRVALEQSSLELGRMLWSTTDAGLSVSAASVLGVPCPRTSTYGSNGQLGTPGRQNETCFEYILTPAPFAFEDISSTTPLLSTSSWDISSTSVTLPTPFNYFGVPRTTVRVAADGFINLTGFTSTSTLNRTAPSTTASDRGSIAIFWDDLKNNNTVGATLSNVFSARVGDHHIFQWNQVQHYEFPANNDEMTFEIKLFDSGAIEFHYAKMTNTATGSWANATSATLWLEHPTGNRALPISVNSAISLENTAWRFTPVAP